jgi:hypothetical protein
MAKKVRVHWWRGKQPNFGDELNEYILRVLGINFERTPPKNADLVMVGSVLEHLPPGWAGTVCGAGKLREGSVVDLSHAKVLALRGALTADNVTGLDPNQPLVLGDPALLVPHWIRQYPARFDLGIVPHWSDDQLFRRFPYGRLISPDGPPSRVITEIAQCKRIIASSLHGIIVADAYGIPRQAELFPNANYEGGDFKYQDYASVYSESPHFREMWRAPQDVVRRIQGDLIKALHEVARPGVTPWIGGNRPQISLLVPFRDDGGHRAKLWAWLRQYYLAHLHSVEIIEGHDNGVPFSKSTAVNDAAERARGHIFVILDADAYMDARALQKCADAIDKATRSGKRLWYMPYNELYRLDREATDDLLATDPRLPYTVPSPPPMSWRISEDDSHAYGHRFGAMVQMMPRTAFFKVGGMDERMRGWGSEDISMLRALDCLYCQHEVVDDDVMHFWHARPGPDPASRFWHGQSFPANSRLAQRYALAVAEPDFMRTLVAEHLQPHPVIDTFTET